MPKIVYGGTEFGSWSPRTEEIFLPTDPRFKKRSPMVFLHELGHCKYDETFGNEDSYIRMLEERDAWRFALKTLPSEEIDLDLLEDSLSGYVDSVDSEFGEGPKLESAKKMKNEIMELARKKKGAL